MKIMLKRSLLLLLMVVFSLGATVVAEASSCKGACVFAGPRLASVDNSTGDMLNDLFSGLTNVNIGLTVLDWNSIAQGELNLNDFLTNLQIEAGVSTPEQALGLGFTLDEYLEAIIVAANASGDTVLEAALNDLQLDIVSLDQDVVLDDFLEIAIQEDSFANVDLNVLELMTGLVQLYNYENVVTTPNPISFSGSNVGMGSLVGDIDTYIQVVEPPIYVCGEEGVSFYSAAIRLKNNISLLNLGGSLDDLESEILSEIGLGATDVSADLVLTDLKVYVDVARVAGVIDSIDYLAEAVNLDVSTGVVDVYIGEIDDSIFFNRNSNVDVNSDLGFGDAGSLSITIGSLLGDIFDENVNVSVRSYARGASESDYLTFNGVLPETQTVTVGSVFVDNLMDELVANLEIEIDTSLGILDPFLETSIIPELKIAYFEVVDPIIRDGLFDEVIDPLLELVGVRLGQAILTVETVFDDCEVIEEPEPPKPPRGGGGGGPTPKPKPGSDPGPTGVPVLEESESPACLETVEEIDLSFTDENPELAGYEYVDFLKRTRIIETGEFVMNGYEQDDRAVVKVAGYLNPTLRYEMFKMAMLSNCLPILEDISGDFEFGDITRELVGTEAEKYVKRVVYSAYEYGIINGYEDALVRAYQPVSRAESMKVLVNAAGLNDRVASWETKFDDVFVDDWFSNYVMIAKNLGVVEGYNREGVMFGPADMILRSDAAKVVSEMMKHSLRVSESFKSSINTQVN